MRSDMGRCVIERPRIGRSNLSRKVGTFGKIVDGEYYGETKIPVARRRAYGHNHKESTDVLGPINGYLRASIGRYWDDVYSEICRVLSKGGVAVEHVRYDHIDVATCVEKVRGRLYEVGKYGDSGEVSGFYVDPDTARLAWTRESHFHPKKVILDRARIPDTDAWFVRVGGLWFVGKFVRVDAMDSVYSYYKSKWPHDSRERFVVEKSCNKKEIQRAIALCRSC